MPRRAQPRHLDDRGLWYIQVNRERIPLARDEDYDTPQEAEEAAWAAFHRMMAERADARTGRCPPLGLVAERYFEDLKDRAGRDEVEPRVVDDYLGRVIGFIERHGGVRADQIGTAEVDAFLASKAWGANRKVDFVRVLTTIYRWARKRGMVACLPPEPSRAQPRKLKREYIPTWDEVQAVLGAIRTDGFRDFAAFVAMTGSRPCEAARLEAQHLEDGVAVLKQHKTSRKTQVVRSIVMPAPAREIAGRLAAARPSGPLFRNEKGNAWTQYGWAQAFNRAKRKAGIAKAGLTMYTFRHARATELLLAGVSLTDVAALLGNDPSVTGRTYSDVVNRRDHLKRVAERGLEANGPTSQPPDEPARPNPPA